MPEFNFAREDERHTGPDITSSIQPVHRDISPTSKEPITSIPAELRKSPVRKSQKSTLEGSPNVIPIEDKPGEKQSYPSAGTNDTQDNNVPQSLPEDLSAEISDEFPIATELINTSFSASEQDTQQLKSHTHKKMKFVRVTLPLIGLLVCIFIAIWHFNLYPPIRQAIFSFFQDNPEAITDSSSTIVESIPPEDVLPESIPREWEYFIQVSSWKELAKAQKDATRYKSQGISASVESEYIPLRRATFYRVRIGPFSDFDLARSFRDSLHYALNSDTFIDSIRITPGSKKEFEQAISQPQINEEKSSMLEDQQKIVEQPRSGFAVKVSSYRTSETALREAEVLLKRGFPAIVVRKTISSGEWFRVLVGPFPTKKDADKYCRLVNVIAGNEAYTIDMSGEE